MKQGMSWKDPSVLSVILLSLFVFPTGLRAQVEKGLDEVNASGGLFFESSGGSTMTSFQMDVTLGRFVTDALEVGTIFGINKMESIDAFGTMNAFLSYHFPDSFDDLEVPFIGARIGFDYGNDYHPFVYGAFGGVKVFTKGGGGAYSVQLFYTGRRFEGHVFHRYGVENGISIFF